MLEPDGIFLDAQVDMVLTGRTCDVQRKSGRSGAIHDKLTTDYMAVMAML